MDATEFSKLMNDSSVKYIWTVLGKTVSKQAIFPVQA